VAAWHRDYEAAESLQREIAAGGGEAMGVRTDVTNEEEVRPGGHSLVRMKVLEQVKIITLKTKEI
jgi:hypothetical protein